jgi:hypothetical protein
MPDGTRRMGQPRGSHQEDHQRVLIAWCGSGSLGGPESGCAHARGVGKVRTAEAVGGVS